MKVLFIEDDPQIIEPVNLCFELNWPEVEMLSAPEDGTGLGLAETDDPDVVILDIGLPDIDGMDVLRRIRSFSRVPLVVLTVRSGEGLTAQAFELGADDYITKPFAPSELLSRLRAVIARGWMPWARVHGRALPQERLAS